MNGRKSLVAVLAVMVCLMIFGQAFSQDGDGKKGKGGGDKAGEKAGGMAEKMGGMAEMMAGMQKYMASAKPGPAHKKLEHFVGEWETVSKMWMDPSAPPVETKGSSTLKWVLDKRFIMEEFHGKVMMPTPTGEMKEMDFTGIGYTGHDNFRKMYVGTWMDTMGTQQLHFAGAMSPDGKTLTFYGEMDEPMLDVHGRMVKYQTKIVSDDKHVFTIYDLHAGDNYKVMEITYTRKS
jgi:roadblock/LC7 domain-containing protein